VAAESRTDLTAPYNGLAEKASFQSMALISNILTQFIGVAYELIASNKETINS
jgi:hypothetical protein